MESSIVHARQRGSAAKLVLIVLAAGVAAYFILPKFKTAVDQKIEEVGGWDDAARKHDPVGFIDYSIGRLDDNIQKFSAVKGDLALAKAKLQKLHDDNQAKLGFAGKQLDELKTAYKDATGGKGWPVQLAGQAYDEGQLKQQVSLLLSQKGAFESVLKQTTSGLETTTRREAEIVGRVAESKAKLDLLRTQKELVKVNQLTADTERLLGEVHDVLVQNEAMTAENPVRTVEELMKQAESGSSTANANVDAFLNG
ncbi:MAG: hypothetical protein FJ293_14860 [Planctomycetes bacterium]|nr:hypothetical protein [Planctomycetota bacterium]